MATRKAKTTKTETEAATTEVAGQEGSPNGAKAETLTKPVEVPALEIVEEEFYIEGLSSLICHNWSKKATEEMLAKQQKKAQLPKEAKDPERDYQESLYRDGDRYVFPAIAFKKSLVRAGTYLDLTMTFLRGAFHVVGPWVEIEGTPEPREDHVRIGKGTSDLRYRGEFPIWRAKLLIRYNRRVINTEQLATLINHAGFSVGVGEWRPEKDGSSGMFRCLDLPSLEAEAGA